MFCITFLVRLYISAPIVGFLTSRLIDGHMRGFARGAATVTLNVGVSSPITSAIVAALFTDPDDFASTYIAALSTTMPMTMVASYFIIGPAVKLLFNNRITPARGLQALRNLGDHAMSILRLLGM